MAYYDIALLAADPDFQQRTAACYSTQPDQTMDPLSWSFTHAWGMAGQPGFGDAYASALASGVPNPGRDPAVIADAQILTAVQSIGV